MKQASVFIAATFLGLILILAGNGVSYAYEKRLDDQVSRKEYEKLRQELEALKAQMRLLLDKEAPLRPEPKQAAGAAQVETKPGAAAQPADSISRGDREKEAEEAKAQLDEFLRQQKLLFKPGELQLEVSVSYAQDTSENIFKFETRSVNTSLTARYGLAEDLEFVLGVPFAFIEQEQGSSPFVVGSTRTRTDNVGLGNISGSLRYAAWREEAIRPDVVLFLLGQSPTGDEDRGLRLNTLTLNAGHWNVGAGVTLVKTIDPVVFFGSLGYTATLEQRGIDPGDQIPYSIGMGFSLNDKVSISTVLAGAAVRRTEVNGEESVGSAREFATLQFITTAPLSKNLYLEPFVGVGLTEEASDFLVGISVLYRLEGRFPLPFFRD
ncbi:MAG: transporter [Pseudomonadota bacterium]|nr:transporter [Pseudomonadota bacterium]